MERKEAIKILKYILTRLTEEQLFANWDKAIDFAISSLETDEAYQLEYEKVDAIPRESIEQMVEELYKEADLMIDREGEDCMAILIDDAIDIIHKYTKEQ